MKVFVFLLLVGVSMAMRLTTPAFDKFIETHSKIYKSDDEHNRRYWIFLTNMVKWNFLNLVEQGTAKYGPTQFADLNQEEFRAQYLSPVTDKDEWYFNQLEAAATISKPSAAKVDWRQKGAVTKVKNQGLCGSCWAFSTTGNIEGIWEIKTGKLVSFSEQELLDCDKVDLACSGGLPYQAYNEIMRIGGLMSEAAYPYEAIKGTCRFDKSKVVAIVIGRQRVSTDERQIASFVQEYGPVSIGINAEVMQFYQNGISHPTPSQCNHSDLDHGVLIVGYGTENSVPYWIIKNSWDVKWGEEGYYRAYRGAGVCGLNRMVTSAKV